MLQDSFYYLSFLLSALGPPTSAVQALLNLLISDHTSRILSIYLACGQIELSTLAKSSATLWASV